MLSQLLMTKTDDDGQPRFRLIAGDREALEREALVALIFDEPRYEELKQQLFDRPPPVLRLIQSLQPTALPIEDDR
jgi:hypothetical protein